MQIQNTKINNVRKREYTIKFSIKYLTSDYKKRENNLEISDVFVPWTMRICKQIGFFFLFVTQQIGCYYNLLQFNLYSCVQEEKSFTYTHHKSQLYLEKKHQNFKSQNIEMDTGHDILKFLVTKLVIRIHLQEPFSPFTFWPLVNADSVEITSQIPKLIGINIWSKSLCTYIIRL